MVFLKVCICCTLIRKKIFSRVKEVLETITVNGFTTGLFGETINYTSRIFGKHVFKESAHNAIYFNSGWITHILKLQMWVWKRNFMRNWFWIASANNLFKHIIMVNNNTHWKKKKILVYKQKHLSFSLDSTINLTSIISTYLVKGW